MNRRGFRLLLAAAVVCCAAVVPVHAQIRALRVLPPPATARPGAAFPVIRWIDQSAEEIFPGFLSTITWYYATRPDGSDRRRMTTFFREDFSSGFMRNWRAFGEGQDWTVRKMGRTFLSGPGRSTAVSADRIASPDVVVSALVRVPEATGEAAVGLRVQADGSAYRFALSPAGVALMEADRLAGDRMVAGARGRTIEPGRWYWCEIGLMTRKREVVARARVFDEDHRRLVVELGAVDRPRNFRLLGPGQIALMGAADFAEVFVDPWGARWVDDSRNEFQWDTTELPEGEYYLVAEIVDGRNPARVITSEAPVRIRGFLAPPSPAPPGNKPDGTAAAPAPVVVVPN